MPNNKEHNDDLLTIIKQIIKDEIQPSPKEIRRSMNENEMVSIVDHLVEPTENDGFIEVRDHQLFIINAKKNGRQPTLLPNKQLNITVNGRTLTKETVVFERDEITCTPTETLTFETKISKDKMKVTLKLHPDLFSDYRYANQKRSLRFRLLLEPFSKACDVQAISSEIVGDLNKKGIKIEFNTSSIMQELLDPTFSEVVIVEGLPMIETRDGYLEVLFSKDPEEILEETNGQVDFKNRIKIPLVQAGAVIARVHPPIQGKEGYNVFGDQLIPKQGKKVEVRAKSKVKITDDGQVIALKAGRPTMTGSVTKYFNILETYEVDGDVDLKTGNIYFTGDLIIRGDVKEGMRVEASGNIYIYGNVYFSNIVSSQSIYVNGTVVSSQLYGGHHGLFYSRIFEIVENLYLTLNKLDAALKQVLAALEKQNKTYNYGFVLATLVRTKFSNVKKYTEEFYQTIEEMDTNRIEVPIQFKLIERVLHTFRKDHLMETMRTNEMIDSIRFALKKVISKLESSIEEESNIEVNDANLSTIKTNGSITVRNLGIVNCHLFAGMDCLFVKKDSLIRGGSIEAVNRIVAGEVGTERGNPPRLSAGKSIKIQHLRQGKLSIDRQNVIIDREVSMLHLYIDAKTGSINGYPKSS